MKVSHVIFECRLINHHPLLGNKLILLLIPPQNFDIYKIAVSLLIMRANELTKRVRTVFDLSAKRFANIKALGPNPIMRFVTVKQFSPWQINKILQNRLNHTVTSFTVTVMSR